MVFFCPVLQCDSVVFSTAGPEIWAKPATDSSLPPFVCYRSSHDKLNSVVNRLETKRHSFEPDQFSHLIAVSVFGSLRKEVGGEWLTGSLPCAGNPLTYPVLCSVQHTATVWTSKAHVYALNDYTHVVINTNINDNLLCFMNSMCAFLSESPPLDIKILKTSQIGMHNIYLADNCNNEIIANKSSQ